MAAQKRHQFSILSGCVICVSGLVMNEREEIEVTLSHWLPAALFFSRQRQDVILPFILLGPSIPISAPGADAETWRGVLAEALLLMHTPYYPLGIWQ
jgi:hypothetical protein